MTRIHLRPYQAQDLNDLVTLWYQTWHATFPEAAYTHTKGKAHTTAALIR
ncbi:MAG: hypothetical protein ETSY1_37540 [Candidatus Entotheonella factor]|uniref:Uncharacterized protein n=1 Tax=Entotheonella factor TaxID=1429438 RepID=W4L733_ENTF1|nr:MAG: hypothetical protein ETSY1_37540 [Candidatus Entotheonella factor]